MKGQAKVPRILTRKYGNVIRTNVEILANQWHRMNDCTEKYKLTKNDIIAQALQLWFNTVDNQGVK